MTTKTIGVYSAPAAVRLPELASERRASSRPSWTSVDFGDVAPSTALPVPRRYEETRQFVVQDFTHHRILKVGHDVQHRLAEEARSSQQEAVQQREQEVRQDCERQTEKRLQELRSQLAMQHEFKVSRLRQEHERVVQEKVLETETAMRKELLEAVEREREEAKRRLREREEELAIEWEAESARRVQAARSEERAAASEERSQLLASHARQLGEQLQQQQRLREESVRRVAEEKDEEMLRELLKVRNEYEAARKREAAASAAEAQRQREEFAGREAELLTELEEAESAHAATRRRLAEAEDELIRIYEEFGTFIDRVLRLNTSGGGQFLLPYTDFLRNVADKRRDGEAATAATEAAMGDSEGGDSRPGSSGTVRLQKVALPSNVQLVTDFS